MVNKERIIRKMGPFSMNHASAFTSLMCSDNCRFAVASAPLTPKVSWGPRPPCSDSEERRVKKTDEVVAAAAAAYIFF